MSHQLLCTHRQWYLGQENLRQTITTPGWRRACTSKQELCVLYYLYKKNNEEIEVGYSSELLK